MRKIVLPPAAKRRASTWTLATRGQVASTTLRLRRAACSCTAGETPWAERTQTAPSGTSSSLSTKMAPLPSRACTTWRLWTICLRTYTGGPYRCSERSTISTARSTPAHQPRGLASSTCFSVPAGFTLRSAEPGTSGSLPQAGLGRIGLLLPGHLDRLLEEGVHHALRRDPADLASPGEQQAPARSRGDADVGVSGLAWPVHLAAHHRDLHRGQGEGLEAGQHLVGEIHDVELG